MSTRDRVAAAFALVLRDAGDYDRVKVADVAARADVSTGTVYLYFQSKEDLYAWLLADSLGRLCEGLKGAGTLRDAWDVLVGWAASGDGAPGALRRLAEPAFAAKVSPGTHAHVLSAQGSVLQGLAALSSGGEYVPGIGGDLPAEAEILWSLLLGLAQVAQMRETHRGMSPPVLTPFIHGSLFGVPSLERDARAAFEFFERGLGAARGGGDGW